MSIIKTLIKIIIIALLIPIMIYILFLYLEKEAWFWATMVGIGNLMLLFSSPDLKIGEGIKKLGLFNWMFTIAVSLIPIIFIPGNSIVIRLARSLALFVSFVGCSVFQVRLMELLRR